MKLSGAFLCLDCDEVTTEVDACPICASAYLWPLGKWVMPIEFNWAEQDNHTHNGAAQ